MLKALVRNNFHRAKEEEEEEELLTPFKWH